MTVPRTDGRLQNPLVRAIRGASRAANVAVAICLPLTLPAHGQLFEADSKRQGAGKMDIVIRETERRPAVSVLSIEIKAVGSSVGSSFFILCSIRQLARQRGGYRYIVKIERHGKPALMTVGFLLSRDDAPEKLGPEFAISSPTPEVIDLEKFAPICDRMN